MNATMGDSWYLPADDYYLADANDADHPPRQGDLFAHPDPESDWLACQLIHPTCELTKKAVTRLQVIRVHALDEVPARVAAAIVAGLEEKDGAVRIAYANTFFLAPCAALGAERPLYSDFRDVVVVDKQALLARRLAALTHEARVTLLRRHIYFQYRLNFSFDEVIALEGSRIASDDAFMGPKPEWATALGESV